MGWPITASDLRNELRYTPEQGDADELNLYAKAASERIETEIGKVSGQVLQRETTGPRELVRIFDRAESLVSITADGVALTLSKFTLSPGGLVRGPFPAGLLVVRALAPIDDSALVVLAARRLAALWWKQSKNGNAGQPASQDSEPGALMGIGVPRVVAAMLAGRSDLPGIA
jgi:hypothetical protein